MPNRSTGCYLCRRRRTRCDGLRPSCSRCALYGVVCPGYKIQMPGDLEFRDETKLTIQRVTHESERSEKPCIAKFDISSRKAQAKVTTSHSSLPIGTTSPLTAPKVLLSPAVNRSQLYNTFLDTWIPQNILPSERGSSVELVHFVPFREIASSAHDTSVLASAMDTLSLASVAGLRRDERLLQEAMRSYTNALRRLAVALKAPNASYDDRILAAVVVLGMCEFYDAIKTSKSRGWQHHQAGLRTLIEARSLSSHRRFSSSALLAQAKHSLLITSILARKKDSLDTPRLRDLSLKSLPEDEHHGHEVALRLPALLERHDNLHLSSPSALQDVNKLLADLDQLAFDLRAHLDNTLSSGSIINGRYYTSEDIEQFYPFSELVSNRMLKEAYHFASFTAAFQHVAYWTRMLHVQTAVYSLHVHRDNMSSTQGAEADRSKAQLSIYVSHLCRSMPFLIEPENSLMGHVCCFQPLLGVTKHFVQSESWDWLEWAESVRNNIFNKGLSIPTLQQGDDE